MELKQKIKNCKKCGNFPKLDENSVQIGKSKILVIGESPAKDGWIVSGRAFYNKNGKLQATGKTLVKLLALANLDIEDIYFTEFCKCLIDDRKNLKTFCENCKEILFEQISSLPIELIMPMGLFVTQALLNLKIQKLSDVVGREFEVEINGKKYRVLPIFHPSPANPLCYKGNEEIFKNLSKFA